MLPRGIARIGALALTATVLAAGIGFVASAADDTASDDAPAATQDPSARIARQLDEADDGGLVDAYPPPTVTARGWLVYDALTDEPIAGVEATTPRPIASLAKLMTALVAVERVQPDELVTIPAAVNDLAADASRMDARAGEKWPARDLLRAMLVYSANDAALAFAYHLGDGSETRFVELMNDKAEELGLEDTTFASATGLDTPGTSSISTPVDLVALAREALRDESIRSAVAEDEVQLTRPNGEKLDLLANRNPLLGTYDGVDGVKTGFTDAAGYMLLVHQVDAKTDGELLVATFASTTEKTRISDAKALLGWARPLRQQLRVVEGGVALGSIPVQRSDERVDVFACDDLVTTARVGQRLVQEVVIPRSLAAPVTEGDEVGELRIQVGTAAEDQDDTQIPATVPICAGSSVRARTRSDRILDYASDYRLAWRSGVDEVEDAWSSLTEQAS
ncbi:MAG: D-alanyl-D-alanine carboxypeptidase [Thermoleophilia bacterium]|nr:D-alanyl-D-alanine carboxypeptidase [Thermoleophilia bacterium]